MAKRQRDRRLAVAYRRVSTDDQANGLEAQTSAIEAWAKASGASILAWYTDEAISGGAELEDRPGLADALADLRAFGAGALVVAKRDRLARDVAVAAAVQRQVTNVGACVISADGAGNDNDLMRHMLDAFAEHERVVIRSRTRAAMARKRARGEWLGGRPPYGFDASGGILVPRRDEQAVIAAVQAKRGQPIASIVRSLELEGVRNRVGKSLTRTAICRILSHPNMHVR